MPMMTLENTVYAVETKIAQVESVMGRYRDCAKFFYLHKECVSFA